MWAGEGTANEFESLGEIGSDFQTPESMGVEKCFMSQLRRNASFSANFDW
jgi:hypothetical protein